MKERIYKTMVQRYTSEIEDALLKIDLLLANVGNNSVMVNHMDITGEINKYLARAAGASEKLGFLRKFYSNN
jgi:20S proteasome alpha/beta subunit